MAIRQRERERERERGTTNQTPLQVARLCTDHHHKAETEIYFLLHAPFTVAQVQEHSPRDEKVHFL